jgi:DNA-nicking Smr family endonuclease
VADAKPFAAPARSSLGRLPTPPIPSHTLRDERDVLRDSLNDFWPSVADIDMGESLSFLRNGLPRQTLRKLRAGHWVVQEELDLHGLRVDEAKSALVDFLHHCKKRGLRCLRVIHGKGLRSLNREPVLKFKVRNWLMQRDEILAFIEARPVAGGSGAVIVLLKGSAHPARAAAFTADGG